MHLKNCVMVSREGAKGFHATAQGFAKPQKKMCFSQRREAAKEFYDA
jgi:hypothetical protein